MIFRVLAVVLGWIVLTGMMFGKTNTSVSLTSSLNPSTYGNSVTFTATVTPSAATGTVTFKNGSVVMGTGTISSGQATYTTSALPGGTDSIKAVYGGDSNYNTSTSSALTQTVNTASSSVAVYSSANPSIYDTTVTFTAAVTPSTATGNVTFRNGGTEIGTGTISNGSATYSTSNLIVGTHSITPDLCTELGFAGDSLLNIGRPRFCRIGFVMSTENLPL